MCWTNWEVNYLNILPTTEWNHTLDVLNVCEQYIRREKLGEQDRYMLRMGAIVHDMGFLIGPVNHEAVGAEMASVLMKDLGMKQDVIDEVKGLVMATKIPQTPLNDLQKIICDADLDYLGEMITQTISIKLFAELKAYEYYHHWWSNGKIFRLTF